ncbi:hypothetical protein IAR50_006581 [Cryptococcus sp. DSM 104548]
MQQQLDAERPRSDHLSPLILSSSADIDSIIAGDITRTDLVDGIVLNFPAPHAFNPPNLAHLAPLLKAKWSAPLTVTVIVGEERELSAVLLSPFLLDLLLQASYTTRAITIRITFRSHRSSNDTWSHRTFIIHGIGEQGAEDMYRMEGWIQELMDHDSVASVSGGEWARSVMGRFGKEEGGFKQEIRDYPSPITPR